MSWKMSGRVKAVVEGVNGEKLSATDKLILLILADYHSDDTGCAFPAVTRLARESLCSERTIQRSLRRLQKIGLLVAETTVGTSSRYYLLPGGDNLSPVTELCHQGVTQLCRGGGDTAMTPGGDTAMTPKPSVAVNYEPKENRMSRKSFRTSCRAVGLEPDFENSKAWRDLTELSDPFGYKNLLQRFREFLPMFKETGGSNNPIAAFVASLKGIAPQTAVSTPHATKETLDNLTGKMYTQSGPAFTGKHLLALADLLQDFTEEEILQAWGKFVNERANTKQEFWPKDFAQGGGRTTCAWVRSNNARREEMIARVEERAAEDRARIAAIHASIPKTEEEYVKALEEGKI